MWGLLTTLPIRVTHGPQFLLLSCSNIQNAKSKDEQQSFKENWEQKIKENFAEHKKEENQYFSDIPYVFINMDNACVDNVMYGWQL
jgi:hypothetical protein